LVRQARRIEIVLEELPLDDDATYELFQAGRTAGIFQFESAGMRELLRKFKPTQFEHLIALNALYRPGPLGSGMIDDFIKRKDGKVKVNYPLPQLEPILRETFGVIVYQEQVMRIASTLGGFSLGEADILRKSMGKKKKELMGQQEAKFIAGCQERGIAKPKAQQIFALMEQFAGYGFNKSHSTAYALVAYQTAYLKAHYPVEFMAALLTSEKESTDKVVQYINECKEMGIPVLPPDVNTSASEFSVVEGTVRFGLSAVKNVGGKAVEAILAARAAAGPFNSFTDFCERIDMHQVNKRVVESLIKCGAFDGLGLARARLLAGLDKVMELATRRQLEQLHGQGNLFGDQLAPAAEVDQRILPEVPEWPEDQRLGYEKETLGYYVSGHPLARHRQRILQFADLTVSELSEVKSGKEVVVGGLLSAVKPRRTRDGQRMAIAQLEDMHGVVEVIVVPAVYAQASERLVTDEPILIRGKVSIEERGVRLIAAEFVPLQAADERFARKLRVTIPIAQVSKELIFELSELFKRHPGDSEILLLLIDPERFEVEVQPNFLFKVQPNPELRAGIERLLGAGTVSYAV
jgi:DNA polymerase-3 subunit alpha